MADICGIYGLQGCGKTMTLTALGKQRYQEGRKIYSNYQLKGIDYVPVATLEDLGNMHHGTFLGDEIWVWLNARTSMKKMNQEITRIIMLNRKRDVDIFYTCQLPRTVDVLLREVTTTWIKPHIIPLRDTHTGEKTGGVKCREINSLGEIVNKFRLKRDLDYWGGHFDTTEEIGDIKKQETKMGRKALQKGIELEKDNEKAAKKLPWINGVVRLAESGRYSPKKWDLDYYTSLGLNLAVDVKAANKRRVSAWPEDAEKQIQIAKQFNYLPFLAFPEWDKKQLWNPKFWHLHYLGDTYITENKYRPAYKKLKRHSTRLTEMHTYLKRLQSEKTPRNVAV